MRPQGTPSFLSRGFCGRNNPGFWATRWFRHSGGFGISAIAAMTEMEQLNADHSISLHSLQRVLDLIQEVLTADAQQPPCRYGNEIGSQLDELGDSGSIGRVVASHAD